jgi:hypothetical protein
MSKSARDIGAPLPSRHQPANPLALAKTDGVADQKRSHHGFRGVPPPPVFDFDALPDGAFLNEYETAAVGRWSTNTLAAWRLREGHGLRCVVIAGGFVRYRVADIRAYMADATPRRRKPRPPPPAAAPLRRRADVKPRSRGDAVPAAREPAR